MKSSAIPTTYRGVNFRSRIEARWAAFFDLIGWNWEYEPVDLAGYIPDFFIRRNHKPMVVEIKSEHFISDLVPHIPKILRSGWEGPFLILGAGLWEEPGIGGGLAGIWGEQTGEYSPVKLLWCAKCKKIEMLIFHGLQCIGCFGEGRPPMEMSLEVFIDVMMPDMRKVDKQWAKAQNATQWRA